MAPPEVEKYRWVNESGIARGTGGTTNQGLLDTEVQVGQRNMAPPGVQRYRWVNESAIARGTGGTTTHGLSNTKVQVG